MRTESCLRPGCTRTPRARGLCHADYVTAYRLVHEGRVTWAELEATRRALPLVLSQRTSVRAWFLGKEWP